MLKERSYIKRITEESIKRGNIQKVPYATPEQNEKRFRKWMDQFQGKPDVQERVLAWIAGAPEPPHPSVSKLRELIKLHWGELLELDCFYEVWDDSCQTRTWNREQAIAFLNFLQTNVIPTLRIHQRL